MGERLDYSRTIPEGIRALDAVYGYVRRCSLPATLIDLVYLRVSQINGCAYCIDLHTRDLRAAGVGIEKLMLVAAWREAEALFDARERAAFRWAEAVTRVEATGVPDAAHADVVAAFDDRELADLTLAISLMNAYNRLAISFRRTPASARQGTIASGHHR